jgi:phosphoribosylanthranilate isomerase
VKVKICGITRSVDLIAAIEAGTDMLGFVFAASPRKISLEDASSLAAAVPRHVGRVGLFMDDSRELVSETLDTVSLDLLQFHGSEDSQFCRSFGVPYVKALGMGSGPLSFEASSQYPDAVGFIYDGHAPGKAGGSGKHLTGHCSIRAIRRPG